MKRMSGLSKFIATALLSLAAIMAGSVQAEEGKVFDHATTGFDLIGAHSLTACESCHVGGEFGGTPRNCEGCHKINSRVSATPQPPNHIATTAQCDSCHQEIAWQGVVMVDHTQVMGPCLQCHNNAIVPGQSFNHIPTSAKQCNECHADIAWLPANYVHEEGLPCISCHNNFNRSGQPANHISVINECDACHTNNVSWAPVVRVDHDFVLGLCTDCHHPGGPARGQKDGHIPTPPEMQCGECHNTESFAF